MRLEYSVCVCVYFICSNTTVDKKKKNKGRRFITQKHEEPFSIIYNKRSACTIHQKSKLVARE